MHKRIRRAILKFQFAFVAGVEICRASFSKFKFDLINTQRIVSSR